MSSRCNCNGFMKITATRSVERALNERRRALKLLQKETKRHSGAKVLGIVQLLSKTIVWMTRSYAALRAADLDWIIGPGYSSGGYIFGGKPWKTNLEPWKTRNNGKTSLTQGHNWPLGKVIIFCVTRGVRIFLFGTWSGHQAWHFFPWTGHWTTFILFWQIRHTWLLDVRYNRCKINLFDQQDNILVCFYILLGLWL